ncbi:hypothetical protein EDC18_102322 [Natranaerovirga pectinivora]|uniref:Aromatic acid exporter family member 1 n=1 Tax=Natranaerovirga pectinivora TaxID=682400 RepID=A0A4R3MMV2_9FIRM|nr:aromatic acid exporter family protein [Natranaerovirga pectinivora]TCT16305.1 hypothetical protein EDC18_102322 [Natranaerovirga pectinivora]
MAIYHFLRLKKEAHLFDTKIYLIKSFVSVFTAYIIAVNSPILRLDIISILFGLMMTLEPVTVSGIKSGWDQIYSTAIGASSTAIIITLFGINGITVALSVAFTLYICIRMNWRTISPVAIFTAIYMTQYVQLNVAGEPSAFLTFRLRMMALAFGVLIAVFYNFIFSLFAYKSLPVKRIIYIINEQILILNKIKETIENNNEDIDSIRNKIQSAFSNIDWIYKHIKDMKKDITITRNEKRKIETYEEIIESIRGINHINYDSCFYISNNNMDTIRVINLDILQDIITAMLNVRKKLNNEPYDEKVFIEIKKDMTAYNRLDENIDNIKGIVAKIQQLSEKI